MQAKRVHSQQATHKNILRTPVHKSLQRTKVCEALRWMAETEMERDDVTMT